MLLLSTMAPGSAFPRLSLRFHFTMFVIQLNGLYKYIYVFRHVYGGVDQTANPKAYIWIT